MKKKGLLLILVALVCLLFALPNNKAANAADETATAILTFDANKANRVSFSSTSQVWSQNDIIFTNNKASSTNAVADYTNPVRLYKGSDIIIEHENMTQIVFNCTSSYVLSVSGAVTSGTKVTVTFDSPKNSYTVSSLSAQTRFTSIEVTYINETTGDAEQDALLKNLKSDFRYYVNGGVYTRNTSIYADIDTIMKDMENIDKYFHNPGEYNADTNRFSNIILDRQTEFVDDYLYFVETEVGFGTSEDGKLVSFNGTKYSKSNHEENAIDNAFVTLNDFVNLEAVSNDVNGSLINGWIEEENGYSSNDENVIAAAVQFTAPGWVSPDKMYFDFTKVTVEINANGHLELTVWASSTNIGLLDVEKLEEAGLDHTDSVADLVFSRATIEDPNKENADNAATAVANLGQTIAKDYDLPSTLDNYIGLTIVWSGEGVNNNTLTYKSPKEDEQVNLTATITLGHQVRIVENIVFTHKAGVAGLQAKTYSYQFTSKIFTANSQTKALNGVSWTMDGTGKGTPQNYNAEKGAQYGSSNNPYTTLTFTSDSFTNVTKIVIETSGASGVNATVTVTVDGVQVGSSQKLTTTSTRYTFETSTALEGPVVITYNISAKAIYIKSISIDYAVAE